MDALFKPGPGREPGGYNSWSYVSKGGTNAVDYFCCPFDFVAYGHDQWLRDQWIHSYPAGDRRCSSADQDYPGTETLIAIWVGYPMDG